MVNALRKIMAVLCAGYTMQRSYTFQFTVILMALLFYFKTGNKQEVKKHDDIDSDDNSYSCSYSKEDGDKTNNDDGKSYRNDGMTI